MTQAISQASGISIKKLNDIENKVRETNDVKAIPKIGADGKVFEYKFSKYSNDLKALDGKQANTRINLDTGQAESKMDEIQQRLDNLNASIQGASDMSKMVNSSKQTSKNSGTQAQRNAAQLRMARGYATGGVTIPNTTSTINERGLESIRRYGQVSLLTTGQGGGEILNASQTKSEIANSQQQQVIHLAPTFNISQSQSPQDVIRMIRGELRKINF